MAAPDFIPDADFEALSKTGAVQDHSPDFISDDEMGHIDNAHTAGAMQAFGEHAGNSAALGYLPQLQAGAEKLRSLIDTGAAKLGVGPETPEMVNEGLRAKGFRVDDPAESYVTDRDQNIARLAAESKEYPKSALGGTIAGALAGGAALSPLTPINAATLPGRAAQAMRAGAVYGAASNPGDEAGVVDPIQAKERAVQSALSSLISLPVQLGAEGTGAAAKYIAGKFTDRASQRAANAVGLGTADAKTILNKYGPDAVKNLGRSAIDEGLITPLATPDKISRAVEPALDSVGQDIGSLLSAADAAGAKTISAQDIALKIAEDPAIAGLAKTPGMEGVASRLNQSLDTLYANGDQLSLKEAQTLRKGIDKSINFGKSVDDLKGMQPHLYDMRNALAEGMNSSINDFQGNSSDALKAINRRYSDLSRIGEISTKRAGMNAANRAVGLTDTIAASGGAGAGGGIGYAVAGPLGAKVGAPVGAAFAGGINKLARTYGPALDANASDMIASMSLKSGVPAEILQKYPALIPALYSATVDKAGKKPDNAVERKLLSISKK